MGRFGDGNFTPCYDSIKDTGSRRLIVDVGAANALTLSGDTLALGCTRTGVGTFALTFPACVDYTKSGAILDADIQLSPTPTVAGCIITAIDFSAGTATLKTFLATPGTPVDPANGDRFWFELKASKTGGK